MAQPMAPKSSLSWNFEQQSLAKGFSSAAGVDEAGRGCLAGPVVAAAAIFLEQTTWPELLNDSKKLSRKVRQALFQQIRSDSLIVWGVGIASPEEIDQSNILQATFLAMRRAVEQLSQKPDIVLVDGSQKPKGLSSIQCIVKGDGLSPSIAAASILAKETRDLIMEQAEINYPGYGFSKHKGYGTVLHCKALQALGPCPLHRRSFAPVRQLPLPFVQS